MPGTAEKTVTRPKCGAKIMVKNVAMLDPPTPLLAKEKKNKHETKTPIFENYFADGAAIRRHGRLRTALAEDWGTMQAKRSGERLRFF